jgi:small conductance mechanosensitive channel
VSFPDWLDQEQVTAILTTWGFKVLAALGVFVVGFIIARLVKRGLRRALERAHLDPTLVSFLGNILYGLLLLIVIIAALSQLGVQMTSALAVLGAMGLAIGLALQGSLSNFAAGVMIIGFRPFRAGDFAECAGVMGTVDNVGIFNTRLITVDNQEITVSNSQVLGDKIINYTARTTRRFNEIFSISYDDDIRKAKEVIQSVLDREDRLHADPPTQVLVWKLGESSVDMAVRAWTNTDGFWEVRSDLIETIKTELEAAGITIPFPQRVVHHQYPDKAEDGAEDGT